MRAQLFEYAIIWHPTEKECEQGAEPLILINPHSVLANNDDEVRIRAARLIPEGYLNQLKQIEIAVRPF